MNEIHDFDAEIDENRAKFEAKPSNFVTSVEFRFGNHVKKKIALLMGLKMIFKL